MKNYCGLMRIDAFISFGLQAKLSLKRCGSPMFRYPVGDTFNVVYDCPRLCPAFLSGPGFGGEANGQGGCF